jgi:mono/diheme cytochrome c family protein
MPRGQSIPAVLRTALFLAGCLVAALPGTVRAVTAEQVDFFERRIRPLLAAECHECHGAKKQKGGLRVDFRDGLLKGGESGPALVPGNAAGSLLVRSIRHEAPDSVMPKDRPKLSDAVVADVVAWIDQGAVDPRDQPSAESASATLASAWDATFNARTDWWSFKPVQAVTVPVVSNTAWSSSPVDRFLLARMEARGLEPAPLADRRTLLRRATFVLTARVRLQQIRSDIRLLLVK